MSAAASLPRVVEIPPVSPERGGLIADLLVGAVDLHCHSGPSIMPRILDHRDAMIDAGLAGFRAVVFKDHFYPGMAHARLLSTLFPDASTKVFSGVALNNSVGGINPHAVEHCVKFGGKVVWMPTVDAANHINYYARKRTGGAAHPAAGLKWITDANPITVLDSNGRLIDDAKRVLDVLAASETILSGGHLHITELFPLYEEARQRGVKKLMVNHPTYLIGCSDEDIRQLVSLGAYIEHSISMFIESIAHQAEPVDLARLITVAGADRTILGSDLGVPRGPKPIDGFRCIINELLDLGVSEADIRQLTGGNAAKLAGLAA
jgi:hypothetical protein